MFAFSTPALACLLLFSATPVPQADDSDPIKAKLDKAKATYDAVIQRYVKEVGEYFDRRESLAREAGDKKRVDQIKAERKAFNETGELPQIFSQPQLSPLKQKPLVARIAVIAAYETAIKEYTKAKKDDQADAIEKELKGFRDLVKVEVGTSPKPPAAPGAAPYLKYPEPLRSQLIKEWEKEIEDYNKAINRDLESLSRATTVQDRRKYERSILDYRVKLAKTLKNDPPFFTKEREQELKRMK